jgi:hypothetical protein
VKTNPAPALVTEILAPGITDPLVVCPANNWTIYKTSIILEGCHEARVR